MSASTEPLAAFEVPRRNCTELVREGGAPLPEHAKRVPWDHGPR